jgi:hypothetical protein
LNAWEAPIEALHGITGARRRGVGGIGNRELWRGREQRRASRLSHAGVFDTIGFLTALVLQLASIVVGHALYCIRSVRRSLTELGKLRLFAVPLAAVRQLALAEQRGDAEAAAYFRDLFT